MVLTETDGLEMFEIALDRKALVVGGASGFGLATARKLHALGVAVAIADINAAQLEAAAATMPGIFTCAMDVTDRQSVQDGVEAAREALGGLDTLVNSAGVFRYKAFADLSQKDWDWMMNINLRGTMFTCQAALPAINASGRGRIVSISSISGLRGGPMFSDYAASKFGVIGLMQSIALEVGMHGTTVNCICPGSVPTTGMGADISREKQQMRGADAAQVAAQDAADTPMRRLGTASEIADSVLYLVSDSAAWITGHALVIDGGQSLA